MFKYFHNEIIGFISLSCCLVKCPKSGVYVSKDLSGEEKRKWYNYLRTALFSKMRVILAVQKFQLHRMKFSL